MNTIGLLSLGFILASGLWITIWLRNLASINRKHSKDYQAIKDDLILAKTDKSRLLSEIRNLEAKTKGLESEIGIQKMELEGNVAALVKIVTAKYVNINSSEFCLAQETLYRLGYKCIFHDEEFHLEDQSELVLDESNSSDCEGRCDSMDDMGNCYNSDCTSNSWYSPPYIRETKTIRIIDKAAYVEVVKIVDEISAQ